jgi:hypothetical protein
VPQLLSLRALSLGDFCDPAPQNTSSNAHLQSQHPGGRLRQEDTSSSPAWATQGDFVSKTKQVNKENQRSRNHGGSYLEFTEAQEAERLPSERALSSNPNTAKSQKSLILEALGQVPSAMWEALGRGVIIFCYFASGQVGGF